MTPERARGILDAAKFLNDDCGTQGSWTDKIDAVMAKGERDEVIDVWNTMAGYTCFVDALVHIAEGRADWAVLNPRRKVG